MREPEIVDAPEDAVDRLRQLIPFARLDDEALRPLAAEVEWLHADAGTRLFSVGDPPDGMYGIVSGRVRFFSEIDGHVVRSADAGPGVTFGEGALLVGGGRSRTAVVARDSLLIRVPPEHFETFMSTPQVATGVAMLLAARFAATPDPSDEPHGPPVVAVDVAAGTADGDWFVEQLAEALGSYIIPASATEEPERRCVVRLDPDDPSAERWARRADVVLLLREGNRPPHDLSRLLSRWAGSDPLTETPTELVLLRRGGSAHPPSTALWRAAFEFAVCHHVRRGVGADVRRIGRHLSGTSVALVLGGGGARGMGHIGVLRALEELGIPVDHIGGSSMGAVIGAQAALGRQWREILEENDQAWNRRSLRLDLTIPTVSVSSGRRAKRIFDHLFGDVELEDLPVPYFCTTTNLSRFALTVHRDGLAALWVRASASSPGLWPPVVDESGDLHVDGGQLNNVPTDVMRADHRGPIIAVDVCASQQPMTVGPGAEPPVGLRHLLRRRGGDRFPSLVDTINRCALLGSLQQRAQAAEQADVYLTPDLATVGFSGFARLREAVDIGYRTAMDELSTTNIPGRHGS